MAGALLAGARAAPAGAAVGNVLPLDDLSAHVRMRCDLSGARSYWYYRGTVFGSVYGQVTQPMLQVEGISFSTVEPLADGSFRYRLTEAGYYLDPATGRLQEWVRNPFTGEDYRPEHYLSSQTNILAPDLAVTPELERRPPGLQYRGEISRLRVFGDTAWSSEDLFVGVPVPGGEDAAAAYRVQTSLATLSADRSELFDPGRETVACRLQYQTLGSWRAWMGMGDAPGMMSWRAAGDKCTQADLPGALAERIAKDHAGFFDG